ncbi:LysM domain protein [Aspergillus sclerotialis]|uniref:LysM domain protein n=1 Tax=Aspergillus sclerotialis TaxID=2070753 RepID=A0A3A2ZNP5_9EURO|nr:LysM domain protein [Aspergillus sclerotialis]
MVSSILLQGLLCGLASSAVIKRWSNGGSATGPTDPDVASGCTYWANDIANGDTCDSLESYFGITIDQLVSWNPSLSSTDCSLEEGHSYCVDAPNVATTKTTSTTSTTTSKTTTTSPTAPTTTTAATTTTRGIPGPTQTGLVSNCNAFYLIEGGDTCYDITADYGNFTLSEFYSWNPAVGDDCSGLQAGYYVCVGVSGTSTATTTASVTGPTPQQTGIAPNCNDYHLVGSGDTCASIAKDNDISLSDFYEWNPAVGSSCSSLWKGYYVCVGVSGPTTTTPGAPTTTSATSTATGSGPKPTQSGIVTGCTTYYKAEAGDTCSSIVTGHYSYLSVAQFKKWNPAVGDSCNNLLGGYYYCVATTDLGPQPGTVPACQKYHLVESGDSCYDIEQQYGITTAQFNKWNPKVGEDCGALWVGYYVCVGV